MRAGRVEQAAPFARLRAAPATPYVARLLERAALAAADAPGDAEGGRA
jgi:hypothetical protein